MSHIVTIQTKVQDPDAIASACARMQLTAPVQGTAQLFAGACTGLLVQLSGWQYPVVIDTQNGQLQIDNFEGQWGEQLQMDRILQLYAEEKAKLEARKKGYAVIEQTTSDGSIKLQITEGASA